MVKWVNRSLVFSYLSSSLLICFGSYTQCLHRLVDLVSFEYSLVFSEPEGHVAKL